MQTEHTFTTEELQSITATQRQEPIRVLDLYCGAGGVGTALCRLFHSLDGTYLGVDIEDKRQHYPGEFIQADASTLTLDALNLAEPVDLVWASPPCQAYSKLSHIWYDNPKDVHPTIPELNVREVCKRLGREYIIENVVGCDDLRNPITLTGGAFDLDVTFTRKFETSFAVESMTAPPSPDALTIGVHNEADIARAKHVPPYWGKQEIRSAIPGHYVAYLLSHCPTLSELHPPDDPKNEMYQRMRIPDEQQQLLDYS